MDALDSRHFPSLDPEEGIVPPRGAPHDKQVCIYVRSLDLKAVHLAFTGVLVPSLRGSWHQGLRSVRLVYDSSDTELDNVAATVRACLGYHNRTMEANKSRISVRSFLLLCEYLRVSPYQLIAGNTLDLWDPVTCSDHTVSLYEFRKPWSSL